MKIAFDWEGTLDNHPQLLALAEKLKEAGDDVVILSAVNSDQVKMRREVIKNKTFIPFELFVAKEPYQRGLLKGQYMKKHGIDTLIDDNPDVVQAVRDLGLIGVLYDF